MRLGDTQILVLIGLLVIGGAVTAAAHAYISRLDAPIGRFAAPGSAASSCTDQAGFATLVDADGRIVVRRGDTQSTDYYCMQSSGAWTIASRPR